MVVIVAGLHMVSVLFPVAEDRKFAEGNAITPPLSMVGKTVRNLAPPPKQWNAIQTTAPVSIYTHYSRLIQA